MLDTLKGWLQPGTSAPAAAHKETRCLCCGKCCRYFGGHLHASKRDLERWKQQQRDDLLSRVNRLGWLWVDPVTKQLLDPCPFLEQADQQQWICSINDTKPDICRDYPTIAHEFRCLSGGFLKF